MTNLFDLMRQAQGGAAFENVSKAFGLSMEETQKAVAALVPAFAMGLQRSAAHPETMDALARLMATGAFAGAYTDPKAAFSPRARETGESALAALFGSPDYAKRVADQAAALSGVAGEATGRMLPILTSMLMDGMARMGAAGAQAGGQGAGQGAAAAPKPKAASGATENPWEEIFSSMMGAPPKPEPEPEPEPPQDPQAAAQAASEEAFLAMRKMIDAGREMQDAQMAMVKAMMEGFWGKR